MACQTTSTRGRSRPSRLSMDQVAQPQGCQPKPSPLASEAPAECGHSRSSARGKRQEISIKVLPSPCRAQASGRRGQKANQRPQRHIASPRRAAAGYGQPQGTRCAPPPSPTPALRSKHSQDVREAEQPRSRPGAPVGASRQGAVLAPAPATLRPGLHGGRQGTPPPALPTLGLHGGRSVGKACSAKGSQSGARSTSSPAGIHPASASSRPASPARAASPPRRAAPAAGSPDKACDEQEPSPLGSPRSGAWPSADGACGQAGEQIGAFGSLASSAVASSKADSVATSVSFGKDSRRRARWSIAADQPGGDAPEPSEMSSLFTDEAASPQSALGAASMKLAAAQAQRDAAKQSVESTRGEVARLVDELSRARHERDSAGSQWDLGTEQDSSTISLHLSSRGSVEGSPSEGCRTPTPSARRELRQMRKERAAVEAQRKELELTLELEQGGALQLQAELAAVVEERDEAVGRLEVKRQQRQERQQAREAKALEETRQRLREAEAERERLQDHAAAASAKLQAVTAEKEATMSLVQFYDMAADDSDAEEAELEMMRGGSVTAHGELDTITPEQAEAEHDLREGRPAEMEVAVAEQEPPEAAKQPAADGQKEIDECDEQVEEEVGSRRCFSRLCRFLCPRKAAPPSLAEPAPDAAAVEASCV